MTRRVVGDLIRACVAWTWLASSMMPLAAVAQPHAPEGASGWRHQSPVAARRWMVTAANPFAVDAGYGVLRRGGNAIDAAVAMQLVLGLTEPQSSGLGGGGLMLVHDGKRRRIVAYDGRETAPAAATPERFMKDGQPLAFYDAVIGGRSVGVPGTLRLLETAHRRHGKLAWASLCAPAIALAEKGFALSPRLHALIAADKYLPQQGRARSYFYDVQGQALPAGTILRNPAYANTLRRIAAGGANAFYMGDIARDIVDTANGHPTQPGDLTLADLAGYRVQVRDAVCDGYRGYRICGFPLPSSGGLTVLQMLKMLEPYDLRAMGPASFWSVHFFSEAGRLAFADRSVYEADPAFYSAPAGLLDDGYLAARSALIRTDSSLGRAQPGKVPNTREPSRKVAWGTGSALEFSSTSHASIVDRYGNAVALTSSIEDAFGSRLMTKSGFLLNNELTDFSFTPTDDGRPVANRVEANKRPRSSMAPTIAYDRFGRVAIVVGSAGGSSIINYVAKTLIGIIDWDLDAQDAVALPNFGSRNGPTELERDTPVAELASKLAVQGADVRLVEFVSGTQAIQRTPRGWIGGADPRREGVARGE